MLKVFALQCDLFSMGRLEVKKDTEVLDDDPIHKLLQSPNPYQTQRQLLWDYMFWLMFGNAHLYGDSRMVDKENNKLYFLNPEKMEYPQKMRDNADKLIFSKQAETEFRKQNIKYRYADGTRIIIPYDKITTYTDLSNNINYLEGSSRLDALYKVVANSEHALDAKNINVRFSGKFLVAGKNDLDNINKLPMDDDEKEDIEGKIEDSKPVRAVKSLIDIKRYVEDMRKLELDKAYLADYFIIGNMYNIPRDVLEAYQSSTYENQEQARLNHVVYTLQPKGDDFVNGLERFFGYDKLDRDITMSWDHLPFMEVLRKTRAETNKLKAEALKVFIDSGVSLDEALNYLKIEL